MKVFFFPICMFLAGSVSVDSLKLALATSVSQLIREQQELASKGQKETTVHVTSNPNEAEIFIDGKFFGHTPSDISLGRGEHIFKIALGTKEWSRTVQITAGEITLHAEMDPSTQGGSQSRGTGDQGASSGKEKAVGEMRRIVDAIRQCPETSDDLPNMGATSKHSVSILDWDVLAVKSLRAPFEGIVHFKVVSTLEETDEAKRSRKLDREYHRSVAAISGINFVEYRYEIALGADSPALIRAQMLYPAVSADFKEIHPSANGSCWDKIANSAASLGKDSAKPK